MSDPPSKPTPSSIATEDLDYLSVLAGFGCVIPEELEDSKIPVNALPALSHQRSHLKLAHRPSILKDKFLEGDSQDPTPRQSLNLRRDEHDELDIVAEGAATSPKKRARRTSSLGRIRSSNPSPSVRRSVSTPRLKGLNELSLQADEVVPPWTVGDDSLSEQESTERLARLGATTRKDSTSSQVSSAASGSKSLRGRAVEHQTDSSSEREAHDHLRWFARCVVGATADTFDCSSASRNHSVDAQSTPVETGPNIRPEITEITSPAQSGTTFGALLDSEKDARPVLEEPEVAEKKARTRWDKLLGKSKVLRSFKHS